MHTARTNLDLCKPIEVHPLTYRDVQELTGGSTMTELSATLSLSEATAILRGIRDEVARTIVGKEIAVDQMLVALLCASHVLLEDVPGVGKTVMARALAIATGCDFGRVQFTPDVLPSDVTGSSIYHQASGAFSFQAGPIFTQILLADEINRATPRTQAALLEAMEEQQVTVDGETRPLPQPFFVIATQNPIDLEGTFPLPEAQLDRFMLRVSVGYPTSKRSGRSCRASSVRTRWPMPTRSPMLPLSLRFARSERRW